jgi:quercetin dioxygenase-like cupin family protein
MPVIHAPDEPTHVAGETRFTSLVSPSSCGAADTSVWQVEIDPGTVPHPHSLTRDEVFVVTSGMAEVTLGEVTEVAVPGDAILVPAGERFSLANAAHTTLRLICAFPVGGQACLLDGTTFTPPWAE